MIDISILHGSISPSINNINGRIIHVCMYMYLCYIHICRYIISIYDTYMPLYVCRYLHVSHPFCRGRKCGLVWFPLSVIGSESIFHHLDLSFEFFGFVKMIINHSKAVDIYKCTIVTCTYTCSLKNLRLVLTFAHYIRMCA